MLSKHRLSSFLLGSSSERSSEIRGAELRSTDPSQREHLAAPNPSAVVSAHLPPAPGLPSSPKNTRDPGPADIPGGREQAVLLLTSFVSPSPSS